MSTLRVSAVNNAAASVGGLAIDSSGNVTGALPAGGRQLLYNGAMQVSQRGTSTTSITTEAYYTADRWYHNISSLGTWTQDIQNDAPTGSGFRRSFRALCTTADAAPAAGDYFAVTQKLEGQDVQRIRKGTSSAQKLTLSFWVKSNVTGTYIAELQDLDNSRVVCATYSVSVSATWERKTITFPADTTGAFDNDNAQSLQLTFWLGAGSNFTSGTLSTTWAATVSANRAVGQTNLAAATNNYWQITGVQLETGDVATDFEFKSYGQELRECQRYCYVWASSSGNVYKQMIPLATDTTNRGAGLVQFPTTMRGAPTAAFSAASDFLVQKNGGTTYAGTAASIANTDVDNSRVLISVASGIAIGDNTTQVSNNTANARITFSAEL